MTKITIFTGSVYGNAQHVAEQAQEALTAKGVDVEVMTDPAVSDFILSLIHISEPTRPY